MTASLSSGAGLFLARYDALRESLPGDPAIRDAATAAFRAAGLPGATSARRSEAWKYTSLRPLADARFQSEAPATPVPALPHTVAALGGPLLVFVDGRY